MEALLVEEKKKKAFFFQTKKSGHWLLCHSLMGKLKDQRTLT